MSSNNQLDSELESFRQQWLSDLRHKTDPNTSAAPSYSSSSTQQHTHQHQPSSSSSRPSHKKPSPDDADHDSFPTQVFDHQHHHHHQPHHATAQHTSSSSRPLVSALDHFEEAMEREAQGNMGASLTLYRKAYKLDNRVDKAYREKHFPHGHHKKPLPPPLSKPIHHPEQQQQKQQEQQQKQQQEQQPPSFLSTADLISSFSSLSIQPATPLQIEASSSSHPPPLPCPISSLPSEILIHILSHVAASDIADFSRLSLVCKRLAYIVATEHRIWRDVCLSDTFGFPGMHFHWQREIDWSPLEECLLISSSSPSLEPTTTTSSTSSSISLQDLLTRHHSHKILTTRSLTPSTSYPTWLSHFRLRPRIRFNGIYISTVNYVRSGQASTNQATWGGSPIHIVTYYRYLRFFRDGTLISLLTTSDPAEVVHHVTRDVLSLHRSKGKSKTSSLALPGGGFMNLALKGRWRLGNPDKSNGNDTSLAVDNQQEEDEEAEDESDIYIETEGVRDPYVYRMDLSMRSAGKGTKNNKLIWRGFHSYNRLTDDWAEFTLKNDKPFIFSRVRGYGLGE